MTSQDEIRYALEEMETQRGTFQLVTDIVKIPIWIEHVEGHSDNVHGRKNNRTVRVAAAAVADIPAALFDLLINDSLCNT